MFNGEGKGLEKELCTKRNFDKNPFRNGPAASIRSDLAPVKMYAAALTDISKSSS